MERLQYYLTRWHTSPGYKYVRQNLITRLWLLSREKKTLPPYLFQVLDQKTKLFSTIFWLYLSYYHVEQNIYKCSYYFIRARSVHKMRYCKGAKMSLSVRLLARLLGLGRALLKYAAVRHRGFLSGFALCFVWVKYTLQLLSLMSGNEIELESRIIFQL